MIFMLMGSSSEKPSHEGEARTPGGPSHQQGEDYKDVVADFEENGFVNIKTEALEDLIFGWIKKDGEVESVSVDGDEDYIENGWYPNDVEVIITYHTFPEKESTETTVETEVAKETEVVEETESTEETQEEVTEVEEEILTVENSEDLAALLKVSDTFDPFVSKFAKEYKGRIIEFDGNIAHMMNHGDYSTRYDILIYVGDYSETTAIGPSFKFEDVNIFDLTLTGSDIPDTIGIGTNLRITAEVIEFHENSGLFFLKPISTGIR